MPRHELHFYLVLGCCQDDSVTFLNALVEKLVGAVVQSDRICIRINIDNGCQEKIPALIEVSGDEFVLVLNGAQDENDLHSGVYRVIVDIRDSCCFYWGAVFHPVISMSLCRVRV